MAIDPKLKLLLAAGAGYLVLTHVSRPPLVRGSDPGFDWQGQHIKGGQGSAITNVGSAIKTDYVLVATAMKNYALNTWGSTPGVGSAVVPNLTMAYAFECIQYWYDEATRYLNPKENIKHWGGGYEVSSGDPFDPSRMFVYTSGALNRASFDGVESAYRAYYARLPSNVRMAYANKRAFGAAPSTSLMAPVFAGLFWDANARVGIGFDVSKGTPKKVTKWGAAFAAADDATDPGKIANKIVDIGGWGLGKLLSHPLILGMAGLYAYTRLRRS